MTTPSKPPTAPVPLSVVIREGVTDLVGMCGAVYLTATQTPGWEPLWTAIVLGGTLGLHGVFKAVGKPKGVGVALLGLGWTAATWAAHKGVVFAAPVASIISRIGKA